MPTWKTLHIRPDDKAEVQRLAFNEDKYEYEIIAELLGLRRNVGNVNKMLKERDEDALTEVVPQTVRFKLDGKRKEKASR